MCACAHATAFAGKSEDNILFLHHVNLGIELRSSGLVGGKHLHLLNHLPGPHMSFFSAVLVHVVHPGF